MTVDGSTAAIVSRLLEGIFCHDFLIWWLHYMYSGSLCLREAAQSSVPVLLDLSAAFDTVNH